MLDIVQNNPYRLLGIYSNSSTKERVANHNRLKAFLKVGKVVSFPLDMPSLLPPIERTAENVSEADANLTLPNGQLHYALFWLVKATPMDDIAMNHLIAGNMENALSIWAKKENASSLQNRIICALIQDDYRMAITYADKLYSLYINDFTSIVLGENHTVTADCLAYKFLDELCSAIGNQQILSYITNEDWKQYLRNRSVTPLIETLQTAIDTAKASKGAGIRARLTAGTKLMNETKTALTQLKALLSDTDLQYQMIADKVGLEILQCGIDYYNGSEAADAAYKAMKLQSYALSIVVGQMAKDRCQENVNILQKIIENLPPKEVFAEDRVIKEELRKFCQLPDKICHAVTLLNNTKPSLQAIKTKLGATNTYYLKVSTQIVGNALHNIIEEVNDAQRDDNDLFGRYSERDKAISALAKLAILKNVLKAAWDATKKMDTFDMESDFRINRYNQNRSILKNLCEQLGVSTSIYTTRSPIQHSNPSSKPINHNSASNSNPPSSSREGPSGCLIALIAWIIIGCIAGGICVAYDGDFAAGFGISGVIVLVFSRFFDN